MRHHSIYKSLVQAIGGHMPTVHLSGCIFRLRIDSVFHGLPSCYQQEFKPEPEEFNKGTGMTRRSE
jgi:hypothetical protein